jgi:hypothetical protein
MSFVTGADQVRLDDDAFQRCLLFVVETALTLGAGDYDFNAPALRHEQGIHGRRPAHRSDQTQEPALQGVVRLQAPVLIVSACSHGMK